VQVALNKYHTVFLTDAGKVYSCGRGRLGHGDELTRLVCTMHVEFVTDYKTFGFCVVTSNLIS